MLLGVRCGSKGPRQAATPISGRSEIAAMRSNGRRAPVDLFQPQGSTASSVRNDHVDVSMAKLS
jgi:hypothetical protein